MKPRYRRQILWTALSAVAALVLAAVILPPLITLNYMKPRIESRILEHTGISASIGGDVNFSWLAGLRFVAHDVTVPGGAIDYVMFPFDMNEIAIDGAHLTVTQLTPPQFAGSIEIQSALIDFHGKRYAVSDGELTNGMLRGAVRTSQHKYDFDSNGDQFHIRNGNENLDISGNLYSDGSAHGRLSIGTDDANEFFDFVYPMVDGDIALDMDFDWDGGAGFKFSNIRALYRGGLFTGDISMPGGALPDIKITGENAAIDLSFMLSRRDFFTSFEGELSGKIKLGNITFSALNITANNPDSMRIEGIADTARFICAYTGNTDNWRCDEFQYGDLRGDVAVANGRFEMNVKSVRKMPRTIWHPAGDGIINFIFADASGRIMYSGGESKSDFTFARDKTLRDVADVLTFLPDEMRNAVGDFTWDGGGLHFAPHSGRWTLDLDGNKFLLHGISARDWLANIDTRAINDFDYTVSGTFSGGDIADLRIEIGGHVFIGTASGGNITLATPLLNIDTFTNQDFIDDYDQQQFLANDPILLPFGVGADISLSARTLIYNGEQFENFVYSKKSNVQTFSITDAVRGSLLVDIAKDGNNYSATLRADRFRIAGALLRDFASLNISDTTVTGRGEFKTRGKIAYDIWYNMRGDLDLTFDGGKIRGLGLDGFYADAANATTLNAEYMLAAALDGGDSALKKMRVTGAYDGGDFMTSEPFQMALRHTDAVGILQILGGKMSVTMDMVLRGTSPDPSPVSVNVLPSGARQYSLSQIMRSFDPDFLREFVKTHDKF